MSWAGLSNFWTWLEKKSKKVGSSFIMDGGNIITKKRIGLG
jgi:hypothetical protein